MKGLIKPILAVLRRQYRAVQRWLDVHYLPPR
jgi:hypothetical protein